MLFCALYCFDHDNKRAYEVLHVDAQHDADGANVPGLVSVQLQRRLSGRLFLYERHITLLPENFPHFVFNPGEGDWDFVNDKPTLPKCLSVSFEVMPPRNPAAAPKFWSTVEKLVEARPDFISITYGAAGQDRRGARQVAGLLARHSPTPPIAHLTCIGTSVDEVRNIINEYLDSGIRTVLALRGDAPANNPDWTPSDDSLTSASDLIRLIREVEFSRCARHPGAVLRAHLKPLRIGVATFPVGNPALGTTIEQEVNRLVTKQISGADFAITQLFYRAEEYFTFVEQARKAGVTIPIVPGILPPTELRRLRRVEELTGVVPPADLVDKLSACEANCQEIGIRFGAKLAFDLMSNGAPGVHMYTFNQAEPALQTLQEAAAMMS